MSDNPKKKGVDSKRIAFSQKHEVDYLKRGAKKLLALCNSDLEYTGSCAVVTFRANHTTIRSFSVRKMKRLVKGLLLALDEVKKCKKKKKKK